jgi:hypothetical protein
MRYPGPFVPAREWRGGDERGRPSRRPRPANVAITALNPTTGQVEWTLVVEQSQTATVVLV